MPIVAGLPFLTLSDPLTSGEGKLDPLGLSAIGDRLAEEILPGLRARMSRPRFLTAIAVASAVCDGLEYQVASDHVTIAPTVFEWLLVEAFVRCGDRSRTLTTPGTGKAQAAKESGEPMCARTYLRIPTVFGFHGIYKPIAKHLNIVDDDLRLADNGYALLKVWQTERDLSGFLESSVEPGDGKSVRQSLRSAVDDGLKSGYSRRSAAWQGWADLAAHLSPGDVGKREGAFMHRLFSGNEENSGEIFRLLESTPPSDASEAEIVEEILLPKASATLRGKLKAIQRFEELATLLEDAFDWACYLSATAGARAITASDYAREPSTTRIAAALLSAFQRAESALHDATPAMQERLTDLSELFNHVRTSEDLFDAVLLHHSKVQKNKKPSGKRDWFERAPDGATFVRPPYRLTEPPAKGRAWNRPYR
ncbi:MAG: hypothetical protein M3O61_17890, partial [Gemmatimonadota bacterium]|nr:hypothetical protein [Gemmatimonadota bacterium]